MQIAILVEQMRREGYEVLVSPARKSFIARMPTGNLLEPIERLFLEIPQEYMGADPGESGHPQGRDHQHGSTTATK